MNITDILWQMQKRMCVERGYDPAMLSWIIGEPVRIQLHKVSDIAITRNDRFEITALFEIGVSFINNADKLIELKHTSGAAMIWNGDGFEMYEAH